MKGKPVNDIEQLKTIMQQLRDPETGCPWDVKQDFASISRYTIEEAYEVSDAIERNHLDDLRDELGDLLFQVVFHAQMAQEQNAFSFDDVVDGICEKMIRRHPHVFGDQATETDIEAQTQQWEAIKQRERQQKQEQNDQPVSQLAGIASTLPAGLRAMKLQKRAASVGFDWSEPGPVYDKVAEELVELRHAEKHEDQRAVTAEVGDLLFAVINLARHLKVDPEQALAQTNHKFTRRFEFIEQQAHETGQSVASCDLDVLEAWWNAAKQEEKR